MALVKGERRYAADQGTSASSHGDGTPGLDESLAAKRDQAIKDEKEREQKLRDDANALLKTNRRADEKRASKSSS